MTIGLSTDAPTSANVQAPQTSKACHGSRRASFSLSFRKTPGRVLEKKLYVEAPTTEAPKRYPFWAEPTCM